MKESVLRACRAALAILGHLLLGAVVLIGIRLMELLFHVLWAEHDPKFFDWLPVRWIVDGSDLGVMLVFGFWGIVEANEKLRR
jgi:hypothetical protein